MNTLIIDSRSGVDFKLLLYQVSLYDTFSASLKMGLSLLPAGG